MNPRTIGLAVLAAATIAAPVTAHHSFAMFDGTKKMTVEGTVKQFQWTNPHSWIYLTAVDPQGQPTDWAVEMGPPSGLSRQGWTPKTLTAGMKVTVLLHPLRDGKPGGQFMAVTLPDGKQLGNLNGEAQPNYEEGGAP